MDVGRWGDGMRVGGSDADAVSLRAAWGFDSFRLRLRVVIALQLISHPSPQRCNQPSLPQSPILPHTLHLRLQNPNFSRATRASLSLPPQASTSPCRTRPVCVGRPASSEQSKCQQLKGFIGLEMRLRNVRMCRGSSPFNWDGEEGGRADSWGGFGSWV